MRVENTILVLVDVFDVTRSDGCITLSVLVEWPVVDFFLTLEQSCCLILLPYHAAGSRTAKVGQLTALVAEVEVFVVAL